MRLFISNKEVDILHLAGMA